MDLLTTLVVGAYVYSTGIFIWFERRLNALATNHIRHIVAQEVQRQMELTGSKAVNPSTSEDIHCED